MTVNLSLFAGAGSQFFTDDGVPLSGGLLYTYVAGSTTPLTTYTSNIGVVTNSNPIVLDSAGRVPYEIWLLEGTVAKFILQNAQAVQIGSWDNIAGANDLTTTNAAITTVYANLANTTDVAKGDALIGFKQSNSSGVIANAVGKTVHQKFQEMVSVKDFGAVGDGTTNDYNAIQNAIYYAQDNNGCVYFPSGNYKINTGLVFTQACGIDCASGATITASNNTFNTITLAPVNYSNEILYIPAISGGKIGLYLYGTALCQIYISSVFSCVDAIVLGIDDTNKVTADNIINFTVIQGCSGAGIKFAYNATTTSGVLMQGNEINGNFITGTLYGIEFYDVNNGSLGANLAWDDTDIDVFAVDPNTAGSICIYGNPQLPPARTTWNHRGFFGGATDALIKGNANANTFNLALSTAAPYDQMQLSGTQNTIYNTAGGWSGNTGIDTPVALTTAVNTRATFNNGNPIDANRFWASVTIPSGGLATGATLLFYFYHPLMTQYGCRVVAEPWWNEPMVVMYAVENSTPGVGGGSGTTPYPFQGVLKVQALANVAEGTYPLFITVHGIPS
jgi:hypothetical protein